MTITLNILIALALILSPSSLAAPASPAGASNPTLSLAKSVTPHSAAPGDVVTFSLAAANAGPGTAHDLLLQDPLPQGLHYVQGSAPEAQYDARTKTLGWSLPALEAGQEIAFSFQARVTGPPDREIVNSATLADGQGGTHAEAETTLVVQKNPSPGQWHIAPGERGEIILCDGRVVLAFDPGTVENPVEMGCQPLQPVEVPPDLRVFARFELATWQTEQPHDPVDAFARPVTMTVAYTPDQMEGLLEEGIQLVTWDEVQSAWTPLPSQLDPDANLVTAQVSRPGLYGLQAESGTYFPPRIEAGQVSLFSGDSTFAYELETPAGAGGLNLPLTLRYNGGVANSLYGVDNTDGGWVGVGWTLAASRAIR